MRPYLRLMPRSLSTNCGKRPIKTVPVKLLRAKEDVRYEHADGHFAMATIKEHFRRADGIRNPIHHQSRWQGSCSDGQRSSAYWTSHSDAHGMQSSVYMTKHRVPSGQKLHPSVYNGFTFRNRRLTYSGPTYIAIRRLKHEKCNAASHGLDLRNLVEEDAFKGVACTGAGKIKPIWMIFTLTADQMKILVFRKSWRRCRKISKFST